MSFRSGCSIFLIFFVLWLIFVSFWGDILSPPELRLDYRRAWVAFFEPYEAAQLAYDEQRYLEALDQVNAALQAAQDSTGLDSTYVTKAYELKALSHIALWQYIDAETTLHTGLSYARDDEKDRLQYRLDEVLGRIEKKDSERDTYTLYLALPGLGPGEHLQGKVVIAYVLVDDGMHSTWSSRNREFVLNSLSHVEDWLHRQAKEYGVAPLTFVRRIFHYGKDPWLRKAIQEVNIDELQVGYNLAQRVAGLEGAASVNGMLRTLVREEDADQAILLLHIGLKSRSYAVRCRTPCADDAEYAYLLRKPARKYWDAVPYVQAHEALHLFGADDLYNITGGRNYAPRDVMHHSSKYLDASTIDSLTAYAIGWSRELPLTPFPVQTRGYHP